MRQLVQPNAEEVLRSIGLDALADHRYSFLTHPRYVFYDEITREPEHLVCRTCGEKIAGWADDDVAEQRHDHLDDGKIVSKIIMRQKFRRLGNCWQARFVLDSGSVYEPLVCRDCAFKLDHVTAQELYFSDLTEMVAESMMRGRGSDYTLQIVRDLYPRTIRRV